MSGYPRALNREQAASAPSPLPPGDSNANPKGLSLPELLREDLETHGRSLMSPGFWALAVHRFGNWRMGVRAPLLRAPLTAAYRTAYQACIALFGIDLPYNVRIGRRLRIVQGGCIVIGAWSLGDDVILRGPVTIGLARRDAPGTPILGDRVEVAPRACVVGGIHVGDDAFVAPCTVLTQDLPAGAVAVGNPCRRVELSSLVSS